MSQVASNGVTFQFYLDATTGGTWVEYSSPVESISLVFYTSQATLTVLDAPRTGTVKLPWTGTPDFWIAAYQDFLVRGNATFEPGLGRQEFRMHDGDLYTIHAWDLPNGTTYVGELTPTLAPRDTQSWYDSTASPPAFVSLKKFVVGGPFNALGAGDRCVAALGPNEGLPGLNNDARPSIGTYMG